MRNVDARGMSCPQPALMTKQAIDQGSKDLEILVDSNCAKNNVTKVLETGGFSKIDCQSNTEGFIIKASK